MSPPKKAPKLLLTMLLLLSIKTAFSQYGEDERFEFFRKAYHFVSYEVFIDKEGLPNELKYNYLGPIVGYNAANATSLGLYFGNVASVNDRYEYNSFSLYSFETKNIGGNWNFRYSLNDSPNKKKQTRLFFNASRFETSNLPGYDLRFSRFQAGIEFNNLNLLNFEGRLRFSSALIFEEEKFNNNKEKQLLNFNRLTYFLKRDYSAQTLYFTPEILQGNEFTSVSLTSELVIHYKLNKGEKQREKNVTFRGFAGRFLYNNTQSGRFNWQMAGQNGRNDFTYDTPFLGRFVEQNNLLNHQFINNHGAFKSPIRGGGSDDWLVAVNFKADLPIPLPIGVFGSTGWHPFTRIVQTQNQRTETREIGNLNEAGLYLSLFKETLVIYLPLVFSENIKNELDLRGNSTWQNITFSLNLNKLLPLNF
jgi:hypothetical protein